MTFDCEDTGQAHFEGVYAAHVLSRIVRCYPTSLRAYHESLPKAGQLLLEKHFVHYMSPVLTARELTRIRRFSQKSDLELKVLKTSTNCAVSARYTMEDLSVNLSVQVPEAFPLRPVEVAGGERLGISETKWRTWILSCQSVFKSDTINILDALVLWKRNVEKSLEGMEPCPICYCIFHASDRSLPGPSCGTCKNRYHPSCLYKWFKSSGNATCAMCRAPF